MQLNFALVWIAIVFSQDIENRSKSEKKKSVTIKKIEVIEYVISFYLLVLTAFYVKS